MNNIKQITNYDLINITNIEQKTINIGGDKGRTIAKDYKILDESILGGRPFKLGYCCEDIYKDYPIFLVINGVEKEFQLGKTGMLEFQPEQWKDINGDNIERTATVYVETVKVPVNVYFTLDYVIEE